MSLPRMLIPRRETATPIVDDPQAPTGPNSFGALTRNLAEGRFSWRGPALMILVRLPLLLTLFLLALAGALATHQPHAASVAEGLTRFDLPIIADIASVALLVWLLRREGLRLRDLFCFERRRFLRNLLRDLVVGALLFIGGYAILFAIGAGVTLAALAAFGAAQQQAALTAVQGAAAINPLGMGAQIGVSALVLPLTTALAEELIYRGYALPRLQLLTQKRWLAIGLTAAGFGAQHLAYGLLSWPSAVAGVLSALIAGILFGVLYRFTRQRLLTLVVLHWQVNLISLGVLPILLASVLK